MAFQESDNSKQFNYNLRVLLNGLPHSNSIFGRNSFNRKVATILIGMGMEKHIELLKRNNINFDTLLSLTVEDLKNIGVEDSEDCEKIVKSLKLRYCNTKHMINRTSDTNVDLTDYLMIARNFLAHSKDLNTQLTLLLARLKKANLHDHYPARDYSAKKMLQIVINKTIQQCQMNLMQIHQKDGEGLIEKLCSVDSITLPSSLKVKLKRRKVIRKMRLALLVLAVTGFCALGVVINSYL